MVATGNAKRSANRIIEAQAASDQRLPPSSTIGFCDAQISFCSRLMSVRPGQISTASALGASDTPTRSTCMSSGSAMTTGPGRPFMAVKNARDTNSGIRAGSSISVTHFAMVPNTAR